MGLEERGNRVLLPSYRLGGDCWFLWELVSTDGQSGGLCPRSLLASANPTILRVAAGRARTQEGSHPRDQAVVGEDRGSTVGGPAVPTSPSLRSRLAAAAATGAAHGAREESVAPRSRLG